mgnify:CR=1 FL=1
MQFWISLKVCFFVSNSEWSLQYINVTYKEAFSFNMCMTWGHHHYQWMAAIFYLYSAFIQ